MSCYNLMCHSRESGNPGQLTLLAESGSDLIGTRQHLKIKSQYYVYILASKRNGTLYIGVTSDLVKRAHEHKSDLVDGFTKKYGVHTLVYYETVDDINSAIAREKHIKKWERAWKLKIIEEANPAWKDLYLDLV